jgi:hypothetical protein
VFSTSVTALAIEQPWLIHPGVPDLSLPVLVLFDDPGEQFASGGTRHIVLGRETPVVVTDGVRKSGVTQLVTATTSMAEYQSMRALHADTSPLLLQIVLTPPQAFGLYPGLTVYPSPTLYPTAGFDPTGLVSTYDWISVDSLQVDRGGGVYPDPWRRWTMPYQVVDRPAGGIAAQRTWADEISQDATWNAALAKYATWHGLLTATPGA